MSRNQKEARAASVKCIPCNAPVVTTIDDTYVCVDCGRSPVTARRPTVSVARDGVEIRKSIKSNSNSYDTVSLRVTSSLPDEVSIRITDRMPDTDDALPIRFSTQADAQYLHRTANGIEFRGRIPPGQSIEAEYEMPTATQPGTDRKPSEPRIQAIDQMDSPSDPSGEVHLVPDGSELVSARDHESTQPQAIETAANGGTTAIQPTKPKPTGNAADSAGASQPTEADSDTGPLSDGLLVRPDHDVAPVISVILPTKNEEDGIQECIDKIQNALRDLNLPGEIIVSDSSDDRTSAIARQNGARVVKPDQEGYGYAYRYAFDHARGDFIVIGDADTTYDFEELPKLFELVENGADMAIGSRLAGEIKPGAMPALHKYVGNPLLTKFLNVFYDAGVSDAHSGFRVIRREALEEMALRSDGMEFASEMVMEAGAKGLSIAEEPITYHERVGEATLDSFRDGWRHVKFMLTNAPSYIFSAPAIALSLIGLMTMLLSVADTRLFGVYFGVQTVIAGSLLTIVGYQIGSLAIFSSIAADPIRKPRDIITEWVTESFQLEHGATVGATLFGIGAFYVIATVVQWVSSGYTSLPNLKWNIVSFTLIILGIQTVFYSFFLSLLGQVSNTE